MPDPRRAAPEETTPDAPEAPGEPQASAAPGGATRTPRHTPRWGSLLGFGSGQVLVGLVLFLTALAVVVVLRAQSEQGLYDNLRRDELVQLLDNVSSETRRLEDEVRELQSTRDALKSGAAGVQTAREEALRRRDQLQILAGTVPAQGPGIELTISDPQARVTQELILDGIEELRDAGAEVIEINGSVRLTASSWVGLDDQLRLTVDGQEIKRPIVIRAIGDPATLEAGARFRGGLVSEVEGPNVEGRAVITQVDNLQIHSVVQPEDLEHVRER